MRDQIKIILSALALFASIGLFLLAYYGKKSANERSNILQKARDAKEKKAKEQETSKEKEDVEKK